MKKWYWLIISIIVIISDQATKYWVELYLTPSHPVPVFPMFNLTLGYNTGAAFGLAERTSHTVRTAEAGVLRARGQEWQARSQYLPQINGSASYQRTLQSQFRPSAIQSAAAAAGRKQGHSSNSLTNSPLAKIFAAPNTMILGVTLTQNLFTAGRAERGHEGRRRRRARRPTSGSTRRARRSRSTWRRRTSTPSRASKLVRDRRQHARAGRAHAAADERSRARSARRPSSTCCAPAWRATTSGPW